jgi:hypothetical protein
VTTPPREAGQNEDAVYDLDLAKIQALSRLRERLARKLSCRFPLSLRTLLGDPKDVVIDLECRAHASDAVMQGQAPIKVGLRDAEVVELAHNIGLQGSRRRLSGTELQAQRSASEGRTLTS